MRVVVSVWKGLGPKAKFLSNVILDDRQTPFKDPDFRLEKNIFYFTGKYQEVNHDDERSF